MKNEYYILLDDVHNTHNINMHTFNCMAKSVPEAIGKMFMERKDLDPYNITKISMNDFINPLEVVYENETIQAT